MKKKLMKEWRSNVYEIHEAWNLNVSEWVYLFIMLFAIVRVWGTVKGRKISMWTTKSIQLNTIRLQLIEFENSFFWFLLTYEPGHIQYIFPDELNTTKCDTLHFFPIAARLWWRLTTAQHTHTHLYIEKIFRKQSVGKLMRSNYNACRTMEALIHICSII